eukprot:2908148-Rhodomonas_salina.1
MSAHPLSDAVHLVLTWHARVRHTPGAAGRRAARGAEHGVVLLHRRAAAVPRGPAARQRQRERGGARGGEEGRGADAEHPALGDRAGAAALDLLRGQDLRRVPQALPRAGDGAPLAPSPPRR